MMNGRAVPSRREFLISSTIAAGSLLIHGAFAGGPRVAPGDADEREAVLNAWVKLARDNTVTIIPSQAEMGQGIQTTLPALLAEELGADLSRVRLEHAVAA